MSKTASADTLSPSSLTFTGRLNACYVDQVALSLRPSLVEHIDHSGLGLLTPADVHHGRAEQRVAARATVLATAYAAHSERFPAGQPQPTARPVEVWINQPKTRAAEKALLH